MNLKGLWINIKSDYIGILMIWLVVYAVCRSLTVRTEKKNEIFGLCVWFKYFLLISSLLYAFALFYVTLLSRELKAELHYELSFLWEYRLAFDFTGRRITMKNIMWAHQIRDNILLFTPMGVLYSELYASYFAKRRKYKQLCWWKAMLFGFSISLTIELIQLIFRLGLFEFDDMFNNTIGMMLGYGVYRINCVIASVIGRYKR